MIEKPKKSEGGYRQPSKKIVRTKALTHAVELLTTKRERCAIVPQDYIHRIISKMSAKDEHPDYLNAANVCESHDIKSWKTFRKSVVGTRSAGELTVAYLSGPEPTNDLEVLIGLGVRPENIWAFEIDKDNFTSALEDVERSKLRGVKLMNVSIEDYFISTPRRFDIIYFDACGPLPSREKKTTQAIINIFRHSALSSLGVLITNFSEPDISKKEVLDNYGHDPDQEFTDGAESKGYDFGVPPEEYQEEYDENNDFINIVKNDFSNYYGAFITRHIADIASIISPMVHLLNKPLHKEIISDIKAAVARGLRFIATNAENVAKELEREDAAIDSNAYDMDGEAFNSSHMYSLLCTLAICDLAGANGELELTSPQVKKFCKNWLQQLSGTASTFTATEAIACFYTLRHDKDFWAIPLERLSKFNYRDNMRFLCDVPTDEIAFYSAFAQVAYPCHNNIKESKRYIYTAEGKKTKMLLDVMPFDECRYIYDWLSTAPLIGGDWQDESRQLVFRFALDGIAKNIRWYQDDFFYGCHSVGIDGAYFDPPCYMVREEVLAENSDELDDWTSQFPAG